MSCGLLGYRGPKRSTFYARKAVAKYINIYRAAPLTTTVVVTSCSPSRNTALIGHWAVFFLGEFGSRSEDSQEISRFIELLWLDSQQNYFLFSVARSGGYVIETSHYLASQSLRFHDLITPPLWWASVKSILDDRKRDLRDAWLY